MKIGLWHLLALAWMAAIIASEVQGAERMGEGGDISIALTNAH